MQTAVPASEAALLASVGHDSLADFARGRRPLPVSKSSRLTAGLLTAALYALLIFLGEQRTFWTPRPQPSRSELLARLMPEAPRRTSAPRPPPFPVRLTRPREQSIAPPSFTVAPDVAPPAPSSSSAPVSPLIGSASAGTGAAEQTGPASGGSGTAMAGQMASADGTNGNDSAHSGCWDAAWAQSVTDRIGHYFYYPPRARQQHATGVVMVHMVIRHSGWLNRLEIGKSSGNALLDEAATRMVRNAEPLPRIPERMHAERVYAEMPIEFGNSGQKFKATEGSCG